jgi:hypothetical protein
MTATAILALITAFLTEFPELISAVETIVAGLKGTAPAAPLTFAKDSAALEAQLHLPKA